MGTGNWALAGGALALMLAACAAPGAKTEEVAETDPRVGAKVDQICFSHQIDGFSDTGRDWVVVSRGMKEHYRLLLGGGCDPRWSVMSIGLISRGASTCLSRGDTLVTEEQVGGRCFIRAINAWNPDAPAPGDAKAEAKAEAALAAAQ